MVLNAITNAWDSYKKHELEVAIPRCVYMYMKIYVYVYLYLYVHSHVEYGWVDGWMDG